MNHSGTFDQLSNCTQIFIKEDIDFLELKNALEAYKSLLLQTSKLEETPVNKEHLYLDSGKAIGPEWAARCIDDILRTKRFISGVYKAVLQIRKRKKNEPVILLYAGTGPFATLVLPLITLFKPSKLQFVFLEINSISLESLKRTLTEFNAEAYVQHIYQCDASKFKLPDSNTIDIVLTECLQHALAREPQVAITYNLIPQLRKDVILIPEQINLHIGLINSKLRQENALTPANKKPVSFYKNYPSVFNLSKESILSRSSDLLENELQFPETKTIFNPEDVQLYDEIAITTEITIFDNETLSMNDSGLSIPKLLGYFNKNQRIRGVVSKYISNNDPELSTKFIP
ncbi:hypothetical protein A9Q87_01355 [Flavobacteriales bacterium 34_180_T64]|nr:hypothetical protein A9Q87_01355 [Flavobacteriales bacterium 34_180_T64]